jgi:hypothetical protein
MRLLTVVVTTEEDRKKVMVAARSLRVAYPNLDELRRDHSAHELELAPVDALERVWEDNNPVPYRQLDLAMEALRKLEDRLDDQHYIEYWIHNNTPTWELRKAAAAPPLVMSDSTQLARVLVTTRTTQLEEVRTAIAVVQKGLELLDAFPGDTVTEDNQ